MNWWVLSPEIIIAVSAMVLMVADLFMEQGKSRRALGVTGLVGIVLALVVTLSLFGTESVVFEGIFVADGFALFFKVVFLASAALVFLSSLEYLDRVRTDRGEFYWLMLTALLGMMFMTASRELIMIYIGLELLSLSFYGLVGFLNNRRDSAEASLKYFVLGSFSVALWLYGAAFIYGLTGTTDLAAIAQAINSGSHPLFMVGLLLMLAGFGFKMGLAPFHMWLPDTYQGAPTPITAFLAVGSKAAAFAVFLRVMATAFAPLYANWMPILGLLAVITMTWGNVGALFQQNIKRMLAYSGIAHAGYALIGIVSFNVLGISATLFYLWGYLFTTLGAFAVVIAFSNKTGSDQIEDYAGLRWRSPLMALGMTLCLLSLAGLPPLVGFFGKLYLFLGAMEQGGWLLTLVIIAGLNSAVSLYYYANVIKTMYFATPKDPAPVTAPVSLKVTVLVAIAGVLLALFYMQPLLDIIKAATIISAGF